MPQKYPESFLAVRCGWCSTGSSTMMMRRVVTW